MRVKHNLQLAVVAGSIGLTGAASAQGDVLDYNEVLRALSVPVVQTYSDVMTTTSDFDVAPPAAACPYIITYSDGSTDCLRQSIPDEKTLFAKPREVNAKVEFANDSADLTPLGRQNLDTIIAVVNTPAAGLRNAKFNVAGHTNAVGNSAYNKWLSEQRANSVAAYLTESGAITINRIVSVGYGEDNLLLGVHPNAPQNRRVMIEVVR